MVLVVLSLVTCSTLLKAQLISRVTHTMMCSYYCLSQTDPDFLLCILMVPALTGDAAGAVELSSEDELYSDSDDEAGAGTWWRSHSHTVTQ